MPQKAELLKLLLLMRQSNPKRLHKNSDLKPTKLPYPIHKPISIYSHTHTGKSEGKAGERAGLFGSCKTFLATRHTKQGDTTDPLNGS